MNRKYHDMYSLFRNEPGAEEYFNLLPSYLQDQIRPRYKMVDSFSHLQECAINFSHPGP